MKDRTKSAALLAATLIIGMALGAVLHGWMFRSRMEHIRHFGAPQGFVSMIERELEPIDAAKRDAVHAAALKAGLRAQSIMQRTHCDMLANMQSLEQELTPLVGADRLMALREHSRRFLRHGPPPDMPAPPDPTTGNGPCEQSQPK
jgi:hypothetical protein